MSESKKSRDDFESQSSIENTEETSSAERVQKIIAQAGIASRRDAEDLIRDGQVTINGKTASLGDKATIGLDAIKVRGKLIHFTQNKVYYLIYKPKNMIAMINEDEEGRPTLKDLIGKQIKERVFTVGRMDFKGEGAIILTNDGEMAQKILKSNDIIRRYHVKVDRHPSQEDLARLARGGRIEGRSMQPYHVRVAENYAKNALIEISFEGMGSVDVKQFFENKGFFPEKVARVGIGHISADKMVPGALRKLQASSVEALFAQPELAKKTIERLTEKRTGGVRVVDENDLHKDADRKRRGKDGDFVTKNKRTFSPTGFVRGEKSERPARGRSSEGFAGRSGGSAAGRTGGSAAGRGFGERSFSNKRGETSARSFNKGEGRGRPAFGGRPEGGRERSFSDRTGGGGRSEGFWGSRRSEGSSEGFSRNEGRSERPARGRPSEGAAGGRSGFGRAEAGRGARSFGGRSEGSAGRGGFSRSEGRSERPARGGRSFGSGEGRPTGRPSSGAGRSSGGAERSGGSATGRGRPAGKGQVRFKRTVR